MFEGRTFVREETSVYASYRSKERVADMLKMVLVPGHIQN